jgi:hypothetical protein
MRFPVWNRSKFLIGCHAVLERIYNSYLPIFFTYLLGEMTGAVEIEIRNEVFNIKSINPWGEHPRNMPVSKFFSDNCTIFTLYESVVRTLSRTTFGLGNSEFF